MPDLDTISVLCDELGISVNELLYGEHLDENYKEQADAIQAQIITFVIASAFVMLTKSICSDKI